MTKTAHDAVMLLAASQELEKIATIMLEQEGFDKEAFLGAALRGARGVGQAVTGAGRSAAKALTPASVRMSRAAKKIPAGKMMRRSMAPRDLARMQGKFPGLPVRSGFGGGAMRPAGPRMVGVGG